MKTIGIRGIVGCAAVIASASASVAHAQARPPVRTPDTAVHKTAPAKAKANPVVTHVENSVRPGKFTGKCPAMLRWTAHVTVRNPPAKVQYQWVRSDSAKGPIKEIVVRGTEGIIGGESWELGGAGDHLDVWERLEVHSPNVVNSRAAGVKVTCR